MDKYNTRSFFLHSKSKYYELSGKSLVWALRVVCTNLRSKDHCCCSDDNCISIVYAPHTLSDLCFKKLHTTQRTKSDDPTHFKVGDEPERMYRKTSNGGIVTPADALVSLSAPERNKLIARVIHVSARTIMTTTKQRLKKQEEKELQELGDGERQPRPSESPEGKAWLEKVIAAGVEKLKKEANYDPAQGDMIAFSKGQPKYPKEGIMHLTIKQRKPLVLKRLKNVEG